MIELELETPERRSEAIAASAAALTERGRQLRSRSRASVEDALCAVLDGWRNPDSEWRRRLLDELPAQSGFSREAVARGVALGFEHWTPDALRDVVDRELGPLEPREVGSRPSPVSARRRVSGCPLTCVSLAGSIPMPSLIALLFPLLLRSPVLAKVASRDPVTPALIVESLASVDPDLARCISLLRFPSDDRNASAAFLCGDCVVAAGSDETIAALSQQLRGSQRLVAYGSRLSVALVGPATTGSEELAELCQQLALDTALWDQQGCLSPLVVYVADPDPQKAQRVTAGLAQALEALEGECPRGKISLPAAALFRSERMQAEMRAAAGGGVQVYTGPDSCWSVVLEGDSLWRPAPLHRFLRVCPLPGSSADQAPVRAALAPLSPHLSAVAMAGVAPGAEADRWIRLLTELGASRICAPGRLQAPPLGWHHDGQPLLLPMARVSDLELPAV